MELTDLVRYHEHRFGEIDYKVWSPGRINLIGEHTDYNHGYVLPAAIGSGITFLFSPGIEQDRFELYSGNLDQFKTFHRYDDPLPRNNWAKYLQALIQLIREEEDVTVPGFRLSLISTIPRGGGLSSSAALNAGFILAINEAGNHRWSVKRMAELAQYTEHRIGAHVGIMDPFAILAGRKDYFIRIDCRTNDFIRVPSHIKGHILLLVDTGISHDLANSEYNDRRRSCEKVLEVARSFREVKFVSDLTSADLEQIRRYHPEISTTEVGYVLDENHRVLDAVEALSSGHISRLGELMYNSHAGLRDQYRVSCKELDYLVELAQSYGIPGARMMGGGFGGSTINLLPVNQLDSFREFVSGKYRREYSRIPGFLTVSPSDGAKLIAN